MSVLCVLCGGDEPCLMELIMKPGLDENMRVSACKSAMNISWCIFFAVLGISVCRARVWLADKSSKIGVTWNKYNRIK